MHVPKRICLVNDIKAIAVTPADTYATVQRNIGRAIKAGEVQRSIYCRYSKIIVLVLVGPGCNVNRL